MLLTYRKFFLPIHSYYHEELGRNHFSNWFLPKIYTGCHENRQIAGLVRIPRATITNDLSLTEEDLFGLLHSQTRRGIRCAQRDQLFRLETGTALEDFLPFVRTFARQRKLSLFELDVLDQLPPENFRIYTMRHDGQIIISHMYFISLAKNVSRATLFISASDLAFKRDNPQLHRKMGDANRLLHWQSMCDFKSMGILLYDWGGFSREEESIQMQGINRFKESFGGEVKPISNYHTYSYHVLKMARSMVYS
jgi:hypothetical protein